MSEVSIPLADSSDLLRHVATRHADTIIKLIQARDSKWESNGSQSSDVYWKIRLPCEPRGGQQLTFRRMMEIIL